MLSLIHHHAGSIAAGDRTYRARVFGALDTDSRWGGWIVFFPVGGGRAVATGRETTQSSAAHLTHWASALSATYLEGALARALARTPEARMARELERLERLEESADVRAETFERAAAAARSEAALTAAARDRAEEAYLATVADAAEREAEAHDMAPARRRAVKRRSARSPDGSSRTRGRSR